MSKILYDVRETESFSALLKQSAELFRDRPAFSVKNEKDEYEDILYPKFREDVYSLGTGMSERGFKDIKIALTGDNSYEWCVSYLAVTCGLGVVVPIDKELPAEDMAYILKHSDTNVIIADKARTERLLENIDIMPEKLVIISVSNDGEHESALDFAAILKEGRNEYLSGNTSYEDREPDPEAMTALLYTSGTTGFAKGVMLSQKNILAVILANCKVVKITCEDRLLSILPIHHTFECTLSFLLLMYSGGCLGFCEGLRYIPKNMKEFRPTIFVGVPLMLEKIHRKILSAASEKKGGKLKLSVGKVIAGAGSAVGVNIKEKIFHEITKLFGGQLRLIIIGAAPLDPQVVKDFRTFGLPVYLGYGLTECAPLVIGNNDYVQLHDSVGVPLPGVEARVDDPDDNNVGEILIKGPMVMLGYYNNEEATREVLTEDGWLRTGDLGTVDGENHFRITGRKKNVIITKNGKNIYPEEVEYYLNSNPVIAESMVVGSDSETEEDTSVIANVFPDIEAIKEKFKLQTVSKEQVLKIVGDVIKEVNKKLPKYKNIKQFHVREQEFIKTTTQKIKRYANKETV
ncbi:MAG: AMP-binding protein [Oscillospiraceae bacterium]|nr:AMP-binding protein [Oscillospiraceae bacterium]